MRIILSLAVHLKMNWNLHQLDVNNALWMPDFLLMCTSSGNLYMDLNMPIVHGILDLPLSSPHVASRAAYVILHYSYINMADTMPTYYSMLMTLS